MVLQTLQSFEVKKQDRATFASRNGFSFINQKNYFNMFSYYGNSDMRSTILT